VVWTGDAALLTDAAANALLKTLEEPPENTWFFLACPGAGRCWPRCAAAVAFITLRRLRVWGWLAGTRGDNAAGGAASALRLSAGACGGAGSAAGESWASRQQLIQTLAGVLSSGDWLALLPILNHEQAAVRLHWLASLLLDAQKRQQGITLVSNPDAWPLVNQLAHAACRPFAGDRPRRQRLPAAVERGRRQPRTAANRAPSALGTLPATRTVLPVSHL
jgi:DNA polymerase-3 subunit delta'